MKTILCTSLIMSLFAAVQLFATKSGSEKGRVVASEIQTGKPAWAAGMGE